MNGNALKQATKTPAEDAWRFARDCYPNFDTMTVEELRQALVNELADVCMLDHHASTVFMAVTNNRISYSTTLPEVVIAVYEECLMQDIDEAIAEHERTKQQA